MKRLTTLLTAVLLLTTLGGCVCAPWFCGPGPGGGGGGGPRGGWEDGGHGGGPR
ncbi:hypothetical protein HBDW_05120 [Herbaspirillum sp. DW155]|uniref:hypothetical protein n=1 Tax=Herbaspirillum sp. DW155 TaxID=3095609 RepID=UPI003091152D|nr:hypothetical protein HBDW_05120 [Herbaspirillum sp. DW155]